MLERAQHKQFLPCNWENRQPELQTLEERGKRTRNMKGSEIGQKTAAGAWFNRTPQKLTASLNRQMRTERVCVCVRAPLWFLRGFRNKSFTLTTSKLEHKNDLKESKQKRKEKTFPQLFLMWKYKLNSFEREVDVNKLPAKRRDCQNRIYIWTWSNKYTNLK